MFAGLVAAHALARAAAVVAMVTVRAGQGRGARHRRRPLGTPRSAVVGVARRRCRMSHWRSAGGRRRSRSPPRSAPATIVWLARRKIGGVSGDVLGAVEQVAECLVLVVATGLAAEWSLWWA